MELRHDWRSLNEILFPQDAKLLMNDQSGNKHTALSVEEGEKSLDTLTSSGTPDSNLEKTYRIQNADLNKFVNEVSSYGTNFYEQLKTLRNRIQNNKNNQITISKNHFILNLFSGGLRRVLPKRYNVLLFIDQRSSFHTNHLVPAGSTSHGYRTLLLSFENGKLDQFFEPDFSSLHAERLFQWQKDSDLIGQYLENRYIMPCYGIFLYKDSWDRMLEASSRNLYSPWRLFVRYYDDLRAKIYPNTLFTRLLLATQRMMVYFGWQ